MITWVRVAGAWLAVESLLGGVFDLEVVERDCVFAGIFALSRVG